MLISLLMLWIAPVAQAAPQVKLPAPTVTQTFTPDHAAVGGVVKMTIQINNSNGADLIGAQFTDNYPAGLVNAPSNVILVNTCGGTLTANAGGSSAALINGTIPAFQSCKVVINVTSTQAAAGTTVTNHTGPVITLNAFAGADASADLVVFNAQLMPAPIVTMAALPESITVGGIATMMIVLSNPNISAITGAQFTINYPTPLHIDNVAGGSLQDENLCIDFNGGSASGQGWISIREATIPGGGACVFFLSVTGISAGVSELHTGAVTSAVANPGNDAVADLTVVDGVLLPAPTLEKSFSPTSVRVGGTTQMTLTIVNNDQTQPITGLELEDGYPIGIMNAADALVSNTCGGLVVLHLPDSSASDFRLYKGTVPAGGSCSVKLNVVGNYEGATASNQIAEARSGNAQIGGFASAQVVVTSGGLMGAPTLSKVFVPTTLAVGELSRMEMTLSNANAFAITGAQFIDHYPDGMANAPVGVAVVESNSCGGEVTAENNGTSAALSGGTIPAAGSCTVVVNVIGKAQGLWVNQTSAVPSANALSGNSASAGLFVDEDILLAAPAVTKEFAPQTVAVGDTANMTITLTNSDPVKAVTRVEFTDPYPSGMANASNGVVVSNSCGGTVTAPQGGLSAALVEGTIPAGSDCEIVVKVVGTAPGTALNETGPVTSANAAPSGSASATLTVTGSGTSSDLTVTKSHVGNFSQGQIGATYTLTASNIGGTTTSGMVTVTDTLPSPLVATAISGSGWTCTLATTSCTRSDALAASTSYEAITLTVSVPMNAPTSVTNTAVISGGGESNTANNTATDPTTIGLAVPIVSKSFESPNVTLGGTSQMLITLGNPNSFTAITGVQFTDSYPSGMANALGNPVTSNTCGGTVTAAPVGTSVALTNGSILPNQSCSIRINVLGMSPGSAVNHTGPVVTANTSAGADATATLTVAPGSLLQAPVIAKAFAPASIVVGGSSQMTISLTNPNGAAILGVQFTDHFPQGMTESGYGVVMNTCGGFIDEYPDSLALVSGTVPALGSCSIVVQIATTSSGAFVNQTSTVPSANATTGVGASATLTTTAGALLSAPMVSKSFAPANIGVGVQSKMTITLQNTNPSNSISGAQVWDSYPNVHMANAPVNAVESNSCGGTVTAPANGGFMLLGNGVVPANGSCSVVINVVGASPGSVNNHTGSVVSGNANTGTDANATLTITAGGGEADLTLTKSHAGNFSRAQTGAVYSLIASNVGTVASSGTVAVADVLPASLTATAMSGPGWTCAPATASCTRSDPLPAGASYPAITLTVDVAGNAPANVTNTAAVSGGGETNTANNATTDATVIDSASAGPDLSLTKNHAGNFSQGQSGGVYSLIAHNVGGAPSVGMVTVSEV
ncbi:MAG: beta strand repeat-containing protein, partial [Rhodanobacteraceae bacterium]